MLKRITNEVGVAIAGFVLAAYGRLIQRTSALSYDPPETFYDPLDGSHGVIFTFWHGEHFLTPFLARRTDALTVLVTVHRDGEIVARAGSHLGLKFIRGSGDHGPEFLRKKPVQAFAKLLRVVKSGGSVALTADVPKVARVAGLGIITLAKHSGCPIVPVAMATTWRYRLANWDRTCINLPFGRMVMARGEPIWIDRDSDEAALEAGRRAVEASLNDVTARAYALADGKASQGDAAAVAGRS